MRLNEAINLIQAAQIPQASPQNWADLGCGSGLFTQALAQLLPATSHIFAVDTNHQALGKLPSSVGSVSIQTQALDFVASPLPFRQLDGILMANSLHYVKDKKGFMDKLRASLKPTGNLIIIEYDTNKSNPWVPYPIPFSELEKLYPWHLTKIGERASRFGGSMYAAWIEL